MRFLTISLRPQLGICALACTATLASPAGFLTPGWGSEPANAAVTARTTRCATSGLVIWLNHTAGAGTAGSVYYSLQFTNLSGRACTLQGYPGVWALNLSGHQISSAASRETSQRPRSVTLAAGATASALLRIVDAGNFPPSSCRQMTAAGLRVYPPCQSASKLVPFPFAACAGARDSVLSVGAVQAAA
jgi:hypothetical protein